MLGSNKPERISADVSSPTGKWYNQCKFTCKACPEEKYFTVPQALRMHLNGIHGFSRKEYEATYGNAETVTRYWTCLICNKRVDSGTLCEREGEIYCRSCYGKNFGPKGIGFGVGAGGLTTS